MDPKKLLAMLGVDLGEVQKTVTRVVTEAQTQIKALNEKMDTVVAAVNELKTAVEALKNGRSNNDGRTDGNDYGNRARLTSGDDARG